MQEVWLRSSLWLYGGYRHIHRRRHIEISICVSFDYLLPQAYWGFFVLETEVIDMDRKKKAPLSQQHWCFCTSLKSSVPRFTDLGGQGMNQCSLLLLGERRGLVVVMVDCSLRPHCPGAIICLLWESSCPVGGPRKTADRQASDQAFKFVQRFLSPNMKATDCCWNSQYTGL